ncbi:MAG: helix-turn-helix transcriptional regulator [Acidimicrobiales bacterium]
MAGGALPRLSAEARLHRLLAVVPWIADHDGPRLAEVGARFGCTEDELVDDLQLLFLCGLHPYTPDTLIDVDIADGRVWIRYADYFARPLRLTPAEGLALLAAGQVALAVPGADASGPLARGLHKLAAALGVGDAEAVEVSLAPAAGEVMTTITAAVNDRRQVELDYYSFGRDSWSQRVVDPYAVFSAGGQWYLSAWCHAVDDERLFRLDRVRAARSLDTKFAAPTRPPDFAVYRARADDPRVTLELEPAGRWVVDQYPVEAADELGDGRVLVTLAVSERAWLERLLLRLGPAARVVEGENIVGDAARRLLARYRAPGLPGPVR